MACIYLVFLMTEVSLVDKNYKTMWSGLAIILKDRYNIFSGLALWLPLLQKPSHK